MGAEPTTIFEICGQIPQRDGFQIEPWTVGHAEVLLAAWNDPEIKEWNPVPPEPTLALAQSWIAGTHSQNEASIGIDVVMTETSSGHVAGEIGLQVDPAQGIAEVGFWLAQEFRRTGAAKTLLRHGLALSKALELNGLIALVDARNSAAIGLLESLGWVELPTKSERRAFAAGSHRIKSEL